MKNYGHVVQAYEDMLFSKALDSGYYVLQNARDEYRHACGLSGMHRELVIQYVEVSLPPSDLTLSFHSYLLLQHAMNPTKCHMCCTLDMHGCMPVCYTHGYISSYSNCVVACLHESIRYKVLPICFHMGNCNVHQASFHLRILSELCHMLTTCSLPQVSTLLLAPIAPHTCEHVWTSVLGRSGTVLTAGWPVLPLPDPKRKVIAS